MSRKTKEQINDQLDAAITRANRVTIELAKLKAAVSAATELADSGHLDRDGLIAELYEILAVESQPYENETAALPPFDPGML